MRLWLLALMFWLFAAAAAAQVPPASPHGQLPAGLDCGACHSPEGWRPLRRELRFDHARTAAFPLDGKHGSLACRACHASLRFDEPRASPEQCGSCHQDPHRGRLSTDCARCHDTQGFARARSAAPHERTTFPLTGAHRVVPCEACHRDERDGAFTPVDARCVACHRSDLDRAVFPDHSSPTFQRACEDCHGTTHFTGARFDHLAVSDFQLVGAHARAECAACHVPPDFHLRFNAASPDDCVACHRSDYDREHGGSGFPLQCTNCHSPDSWEGGRFDHPFPISNGSHAGKWDQCTDCHNSPGNFAVFTCLTCHGKTETDREHRERPDYVYESTRCLACHPRGDE
jgi:hypothetical protein